jgi:hypothetical protein
VNVRFISTAEAELKEAIEFYEAAENGLGARFLDEVEDTVALHCSEPGSLDSIVSQHTPLPDPSVSVCPILSN